MARIIASINQHAITAVPDQLEADGWCHGAAERLTVLQCLARRKLYYQKVRVDQCIRRKSRIGIEHAAQRLTELLLGRPVACDEMGRLIGQRLAGGTYQT